MPDMLVLQNPRKRKAGRPKKRRKTTRKRKTYARRNPVALANPRRKRRRKTYRRSKMIGMDRGIQSAIIPVGIGIAAGLATPKIFKLTGMQRYIAPIAIAAGASFVFSGVIGKKASNYIAVGALSSVVLMFINDTFLKTGATGSVLTQGDEDDEIEVISQDDEGRELLTQDEEEEDAGIPEEFDEEELSDIEISGIEETSKRY